MTTSFQQVYDVAIIGGGLAGASAASQLAQNGLKIILLEREQYAHHKVCGEFISYEAQYYLEKLGINLVKLGAVPIDCLKLTYGQKNFTTPLDFKAMSLSRYCLDDQILKNDEIKVANILRGVTVTSMEQDTKNWRITCHQSDPILAKTVFLASGKHDLRGWSQRAGANNDYIGFKMYYQLPPEQHAAIARTVEIILYEGGYAGLEPIDNGLVNLCLVINKLKFASYGKSWAALLERIIKIPRLGKYLTDATPRWDKPLAIYGIPYGFVYQPSLKDSSDLFRLGDQIAVIPSLCGDGMAIALYTGFMAAESYMKTNAFDYHRNAHQQLSPQIKYAARIAQLLSSPLLQPLAIPLCKLAPHLVSNAIEQTRLRRMMVA